MAKIEVDEAEYNNMVALRGVAARMVAKPESRRLLEQAQKLVDPNAATPLLDQDRAQLEPVRALEASVNERIAKLEKEQADKKREETLASIAGKQEAAFNRLKAQAHYTDEGVEAIRKLMETKGLLDVDDAVAIFERTNPPPVPATPSGMTGERWNFQDHGEGEKDIAALIANKGEGSASDAAVMRMANSALNEMRGARR